MEEFTSELKKDFPILYRKLGIPWQEGGMMFPNIGKGWLDLVKELSSKLESVLSKMENPPYAIQMKEKFGGLRFYLDGDCDEKNSEEIYNIISFYEKKSSFTCESCGERGSNVSMGHWLKTLCLNCYEQYLQGQLILRHGEFKNV